MSNIDRPFSFTFGTGPAFTSPSGIVLLAQRLEELGFTGIVLPDHFNLPAEPMVALSAVAQATSRIGLGTTVLCNDFRHPAMTAREIATLDQLSRGRAMIGIGAGHMKADFRRTGIPFDSPAVRIARLEEALVIVRGLLEGQPFTFTGQHYSIDQLQLSPLPVQRPRPPILVGGGGRKILSVAGRLADIVAISGGAPWDRDDDARAELLAPAIRRKLHWVQEAAGPRFAEIDVVLRLTAAVTENRDAGVERCLHALNATYGLRPVLEISEKEISASPCYVIGSAAQICDQLEARRDEYGVSHYTLYATPPDEFAEVIAEMSLREKRRAATHETTHQPLDRTSADLC
jgi:probable F420-dependent oxidoreductase